eukprot:Rhum_TRINITY_DN22796_c0_g1::Rhum_TRINITY_DN22796_c0_g1_i1::g.175961::m.175961/K05310/GPI7; ethanolaminephosphotransferase
MGLLAVAACLLGSAATLLFFSGVLGERFHQVGGPTAGTEGSDECRRCDPIVPVDRIVFMVVDGLRYSSVFGPEKSTPHSFSYVRRVMESGGRHGGLHALSLARPPTVTLPRVKSMMTGKVAVFTDVLFNFFGDVASSDSVLHKAALKRPDSGGVRLFGDDTWLRMWPELFDNDASDPVRSFFVRDYTEVDDNVTRHVHTMCQDGEEDGDWSLTVLHYLGVDHIGHYLGADNDVMRAKEREMDTVIRKLHEELVQKHAGTVLVVVSDHGMTDGGNHGGSSSAEVDTVFMMFFQPPAGATDLPHSNLRAQARNPSTIEQIDVAATLSLLLGQPPPKPNTGVLFPPLFTAASLHDCLLCNAYSLGINGGGRDDQLFAALDAASSALNRPPTPDYVTASLGLLLLALAVCFLAGTQTPRSLARFAAVPVCTSLLLFSSTYAEELHKAVHYMTISLFLHSAVRGNEVRLLLRHAGVCVLLRVLFVWTQSGILAMTEPAAHPRLSDFLFVKEHEKGLLMERGSGVAALAALKHLAGTEATLQLSLYSRQMMTCGLLLGTILVVTLASAKTTRPWLHMALCAASTALLVLATLSPLHAAHKESTGAADDALVWDVSHRWFVMGIAAAGLLVSGHLAAVVKPVFFTILTASVSPPADAPSLLFCCLLSVLVGQWHSRQPCAVHSGRLVFLSGLCAQNALGRSISIGHMQFASAYNVVTAYHPALLGSLILLTHFSGFIIVVAPALSCRAVRLHGLLFFACHVIVAGAAVVLMRSHLFIFTVFMPKFLFCAAEFLFYLLLFVAS